ncbi:MAG: hypothetical protein ACODAE_05470 [Gemmatimonadota bacterium]
MDADELILALLVLILIGTPVLAISARIALKPLAEAVARMREAFQGSRDAVSDDRLAALEEEVRLLRRALEHRMELGGFDAELDGERRGERRLSTSARQE